MTKGKDSSFFSEKEIQDPIKREAELFHKINEKLIRITSISNGWKEKLRNISLEKIKSREDFNNIPVTRKSSLIELQKEHPPYAELNTKDVNKFDYMFASPGPIFEPGESGDFWNMASSLHAAGLREGDLVYNTFSYHLGPAGIMLGNSANSLGCSVIPGGIGNTDLQIATIEALNPNFYIGTPSFLKIILDKINKKGIDTSSIKNALVGAEPFPKELRNYLKENYNICPLQMYGTAEVGCIAYETKDSNENVNNGMIVEENIILEIVKPGSDQQAEIGEVGEIVVTKLLSDYPMIRLGTGDLSAIIYEPSPCGRTNLRIKGWMGRAEQSTKVKGLFINPEQINQISKNFQNIIKSRLVIRTKNYLDSPDLQCEVRKNSESSAKDVQNFFKNQFKLNVNVNFVEEGEIPNDGIVIEDKRDHN